MKTNIMSFSIEGKLPLSDELVGELSKIAPLDKQDYALFQEEYKNEQGRKWLRIATITKTSDAFLGLSIQHVQRKRIKKVKTPSVKQLIDVIGTYNNNVNFECSIFSLFNKRDKVETFIKFPIKVSEFEDSKIHQILGFHFMNNDQDKTNCIIDTDPDGSIFVSLTFNRDCKITSSTDDDLLAYGLNLRKNYVRRG